MQHCNSLVQLLLCSWLLAKRCVEELLKECAVGTFFIDGTNLVKKLHEKKSWIMSWSIHGCKYSYVFVTHN